MNGKQCKSCQHFVQHLALNKRRLFRVHCGHCTLGKPKRKLPDSKACENYSFGPSPEEAFASKEDLSKELLQYVLQLELLPGIEETG